MINTWTGIGRICNDLELRTTQGGVDVLSFTLAVDNGYGDKKQTTFLTIVAWRGLAGTISTYCKKGSQIVVQGAIQTRNYEDKQGNKRTAFEIVADNVSFCGSKNEPTEQPQSNDANNFEMLDDTDSDLPF